MKGKMDHWVAYIYERFPPLIFGSLALGVALSGSSLNGAGVSFFTTLIVFFGLWVFLLVLCLSNDSNDITKDRIAFPERPLPLGKIQLAEARRVLFFAQIFLFAYSQLVWVLLQGTAGLFFIFLGCWAWFADKGFYLKHLMARSPLTQVLFNQLYVFLMVFFAVSASQPLRVFGVKAWALAIALYGAMLVYRLCRTTNPHLHPIAAAFIHFYGFRKTFYLAVLGLVFSACAAGVMGVGGLLWPMQAIVFFSLFLLFYQPEQFRGAEMTSAVSLIVHAWSGIF